METTINSIETNDPVIIILVSNPSDSQKLVRITNDINSIHFAEFRLVDVVKQLQLKTMY